MTIDSLLVALRDTDVMLPLFCSLVAGALIGAERELQAKPAGLRTHTLLCFASALMTLLGLRMAEWTVVLSENTQLVSDMARMPHAILTGVGFLGAGVIFREGASVHGLTTAASLWLTAALGIVFGTGLVELGMIGTGAAIGVLVLLRLFQTVRLRHPALHLEITVNADSPFDSSRIPAYLARHRLTAGLISRRQDRTTGLRHYIMKATSQYAGLDADQLAHTIENEIEILAFSITPLDNETLKVG